MRTRYRNNNSNNEMSKPTAVSMDPASLSTIIGVLGKNPSGDGDKGENEPRGNPV
jgi:hypothetical protein